jgi:hypothetical protein
MSRLTLGAYWKVRRETTESCAHRLSRFLGVLGAHDPVLASWFKLARSRKAAVQPIDRTTAGLEAILLRGASRRDSDRQPIPELGYRFSAWNNAAAPADEASLSIACGSWATAPGITNFVVLHLPESPPYETLDAVLPLVKATAECWEPERATVFGSNAPTDAQPVLDWIFMLRPSLPPANALPAGTRVIDWGPVGQCLITQDRPVDWSDPQQVERLRTIRSALH